MLKIKYTAGTRVSKGKPKYVYPPAKKKSPRLSATRPMSAPNVCPCRPAFTGLGQEQCQLVSAVMGFLETRPFVL